MMMVSVILAFFLASSRKAITPLLTASTPVMAAQPEEKTFKISQIEIISVAALGTGSAITGCGCPPVAATCHSPTPMIVISVPRNR